MLAERVGLTEGAISKWINQRAEPDLAMLVRVCAALHVTLDWLLDMPAAPDPPPPSGVDPAVTRRMLTRLRGAVVGALDDAIADEKKSGR